MSRLPPLNPLRAFEAAARHLSVTKAAEELHVTHSAVSHQLRALEDALNVRLFHRSGGRLALSPEGIELLPAVSGAFDRIVAATSTLGSKSRTGKLTISSTPALLSLFILPSVGSFCAIYPEIQLRLLARSDLRDLANPDVDVHVGYGDGNWPQFEVRLLSPLKLFPVCHPSLLHERALRRPGDIFKHVILHADDGNEWKSWLTANNLQLQPNHPQHFMADARMALEAASYGYGIALGDNVTTEKSLALGQMVAPFDLQVPANHSFYVLKRSHSSAIAEQFIEWLYRLLRSST